MLPYFQVDDALNVGRKTRSLVEAAIDGDMTGIAAMGLWAMAGADCQSEGTDGVVSRAAVVRLVLNPELAQCLTDWLVHAGFWHATGHDCEICPPVASGTWLFHDWFQMRYTPAKQVRVNRRKRQELKDPQLIAEVWARDCTDPSNPTIGACRYCGIALRRKDTRSQNKPHLDHVDPRKAVGIRNVVLACGQCNQKKGNRTPQEAGMTLQPPPRPEPKETVAGNGGPVSTRGDAAGPSAAGRSRPDEHAAPTVEASGSAGRATAPSSRAGMPPRRLPGAGDVAGPPQGEHAAPAPGGRPPADHTRDHSGTSTRPPRNHAGSAVPHGRGPGQGQGQGSGRGLGKGPHSGSPQPDTPTEAAPGKSRRRKRRSRARNRPEPDQPQSLDAGPPPPGVQAPGGGFGSPWHNWHGPPSPVTETDCPTHSEPRPCWRCEMDEEINQL